MCLTIMGEVIDKSPTLKGTPYDLKIDVCSNQDDDFIMSEKGLLKSMSGAKPISPSHLHGMVKRTIGMPRSLSKALRHDCCPLLASRPRPFF